MVEVMPVVDPSGILDAVELETVRLSVQRSAPIAVPFKVVEEPAQMLTSFPADTFDGPGLILTNDEALAVHPLGAVTITW